MRRPRPWRAAAYMPGPPRYWFGHTCALTEEGLSRSVTRWRELGLTVEVWQVQDHPDITAAAEASAQPPALP